MSLLQQNSIVPLERRIVTVYRDEDESLYCNEFGRISDWEPKLQTAHSPGGSSRLCVHRIKPMTAYQLFDAQWVSKLHWQLVITPKPRPVIACRAADIVTIAFDKIGPILGCNNQSTGTVPENRWQYKLYRFRWWDEESPFGSGYLGVEV